MLTRRGVIRTTLWATTLFAIGSIALAQNPFLERQRERTIGEIRFEGARVTKEYVLRREFGLEPGQPYSWASVSDARARLERLNFIDYVVVEEDPVDENTIDLLVTVNEDVRFVWTPVASYMRRHDGYVVGLDFQMRNLRGRAETLEFQTAWWHKHGYRTRWSNPNILGPAKLAVSTELYAERYNFNYYDFRFRDAAWSVGLGRSLGPWLSAEADYGLREVKIDQGGSEFPEGINRDDWISFALEHDSRDILYYPTKGLHLKAVSRFSAVGTENPYQLYLLHAAGFMNIPWIDILAGRVEHRFVGQKVPIYSRTWLGGAHNLRGVNFGELEGDNHVLMTLEWRRPIVLLPLLEGRALGVGVHAFHDWGATYDHGTDLDTLQFERGWGAGVHINFNTRNFRIEWARGEDGDDRILFEDTFTF